MSRNSDAMRPVRHENWKLIRYPQVDVTQLFDLEHDPHETNNLAVQPAQAELVEELLSLLREQQQAFGAKEPLYLPNPKPAAVELGFFDTAAAK